MTARTQLVALGSSFAAGPGLLPRVQNSPRAAGRSTQNYAHLVGAALGAEVTDVTYSGATVAQLRSGTSRAAPQVSAVTASTTVVTVTAGGNDVGYLPALTLASLPRALGRVARARQRVRELTDPAMMTSRFTDLAQHLPGLIDDIRAVAPTARIVLVGYLTVLPPIGFDTHPLPPEVASWGRSCAVRLRDTTRDAAETTGADFLDIPLASQDHHAWAAEPWTRRFHYSLREGAPYHPNAAGMQAVADRLFDLLRG